MDALDIVFAGFYGLLSLAALAEMLKGDSADAGDK